MASSAPPPSPSFPSPALHSKKLVFAELFNKWAQSIGIVVAAIWGAYTFIYKEIMLPQESPINISVNLQLKKAGTGKPKASLIPVEMRISATNPSSRTIYLLPGYWIAWGYQTTPKDDNDPSAFYERMAEEMNAQNGQYSERHSASSPRSIVAGGSLFSDDSLSPNETLTRTIMFYAPRDKYDSVLAQINMPSIEAKEGLQVQWRVNKEDSTVEGILYLVNKQGERTLAKRDEKGHLADQKVKDMEYQMTTTSAEIPLWK
jgi:hypothetical protein